LRSSNVSGSRSFQSSLQEIELLFFFLVSTMSKILPPSGSGRSKRSSGISSFQTIWSVTLTRNGVRSGQYVIDPFDLHRIGGENVFLKGHRFGAIGANGERKGVFRG
jgi:hypothetical protein